MKTLLVAVDFSRATRAVLDTATALAADAGAQIVVLHNLVPPIITTDYGVGLELLHETLALTEKTAHRQLDHIKTALARRGLAIDIRLTHGAAAANIIDTARKVKADGIVLGSHGHTAIYDLLVGSTTHAVLAKATCPVVVVPASRAPARSRKRK